MICGIGIDLVEIHRIEEILKRWGKKFTSKIYSEGEIEYCRNRSHPAIHYAARFAAKEAFLKSVGVGLAGGIRLKDIEVLSNQQGKPDLKLHNKAKTILNRHGDIPAVHLSITHTSKYSAAVVVLEKRVPS
ncbi:MAG: holo-ACP synthase [Thermodesulfobacteriota bacterium]|nr:holo-ACP synthase [Thermodesulfobacteriota bacterium]